MHTAFETTKAPSAAADFARDGYLGPVRLMTPEQCLAVLNHANSENSSASAAWPKGRAVTDWLFAGLGSHPKMLWLLTPILGQNIVLWGASLVRRKPGDMHIWHVDAESADPSGGFVTVWIGLENTTADSGLRLIAGSHLCDKPVQQFFAETGCSPPDVSIETLLEWARGTSPGAHLVEPELTDGDAILFDGRMWHGSKNRLATRTRAALLLQFAASDRTVRMPEPGATGWPFKFLDTLPPVLVMQGSAKSSANLVAPRPSRSASAKLPPLPSSVRKLEMPLAESVRGGWRPYPLFRGSTPAVDFVQCHAAVLSAGYSPHPPHAHADEELLIVLDGEAELLIADRPEYDGARTVPVKAGDFAYYPPGQHHSIRNPASTPVTYMMFRWRRPSAAPTDDRLKTKVFRAPAAPQGDGHRGFVTREVFSAPTRWLRKFHCHTSRVEVGASYAPHVDPYDVAMLIQSGRVRVLGREVGPGTLVWCTAGDMHGMRNIGDEPARYLVFEFHGSPLSVEQAVSLRSTAPPNADAKMPAIVS